jgi:hypothetical protein
MGGYCTASLGIAAAVHMGDEKMSDAKALLERLQELGYSDGTNMSIKNHYTA